jgi:hypothetical protein
LPARTRSEGPRIELLPSCTSNPAACWLKLTAKLRSTAKHSTAQQQMYGMSELTTEAALAGLLPADSVHAKAAQHTAA